MAVSPISNIIFINQNMHVAAGVQTSQFNRYDLQNLVAQTLVNEKEKIVEEVRPIEEAHKIDTDREHEKEGAKEQEKEQEETANHKQKDSVENEKKEELKSSHLDIRV